MAEVPDDLHELLDSAIDDLHAVKLTSPSSSSQRNGPNEGNKEENSDMPTEVRGLGMALPDLKSKKKGKKKVTKDSHAEAVGQLREHTREAVKSLESLTEQDSGGENIDNETIERWVKEFEEMADSKEVQTVMTTLMQRLLSKEVLQEPIKEISGKYPKWLEDNKSKISKEEYDRFSSQYQLMKELSEVFETDGENSAKIFDLMQKMQEHGSPPNDIEEQLGIPNFANFCGQLSPETPGECSIM